MTAPAAEMSCSLTARILSLSSADQKLVERFVETLEARQAIPFQTPDEWMRQRVEALRSRAD